MQMLTFFEGALPDFSNTVWDEHFVNVAVLEPLVTDLCDAVWKESYLKNAELPEVLVADHVKLWRKHSCGLGGALSDIPSAFFWSVYFS